MKYDRTFIEACLNGEATVFNIDSYVEYWHTHDIDMSLQVFLGMTEYEFEQWGKTSNATIRDILRCRIDKIDFRKYGLMQEPQRIAARSYDPDAIAALIDSEDKNDT